MEMLVVDLAFCTIGTRMVRVKNPAMLAESGVLANAMGHVSAGD